MTNLNEPSPPRADAVKEQHIERRNQRIEDYLRAALESPNPLAANLGAANSDLMAVQHALQQAIDTALSQTKPTLAELETLLPGIDYLLKIAKQIDRFSQLEIKLKPAEPDLASLAALRSQNSSGLSAGE